MLGRDEGAFQHGAWTENFLIDGLIPRLQSEGADCDVVTLFHDCYDRYVRTHTKRGDRPCFFARRGAERINTEEESVDDGCLAGRHIPVRELLA